MIKKIVLPVLILAISLTMFVYESQALTTEQLRRDIIKQIEDNSRQRTEKLKRIKRNMDALKRDIKKNNRNNMPQKIEKLKQVKRDMDALKRSINTTREINTIMDTNRQNRKIRCLEEVQREQERYSECLEGCQRDRESFGRSYVGCFCSKPFTSFCY